VAGRLEEGETVLLLAAQQIVPGVSYRPPTRVMAERPSRPRCYPGSLGRFSQRPVDAVRPGSRRRWCFPGGASSGLRGKRGIRTNRSTESSQSAPVSRARLMSDKPRTCSQPSKARPLLAGMEHRHKKTEGKERTRFLIWFQGVSKASTRCAPGCVIFWRNGINPNGERMSASVLRRED
jgi:hypothetical protein